MSDKNEQTTVKAQMDALDRALVLFFCLLAAVPLIWLVTFIYVSWTDEAVVSTRSIGNFVSMSGPGGLHNRVVIETDLGFFPLHSAAAITKGTPLILELRASNQRYICDARKTLCLTTEGPDFGALTKGIKP